MHVKYFNIAISIVSDSSADVVGGQIPNISIRTDVTNRNKNS